MVDDVEYSRRIGLLLISLQKDEIFVVAEKVRPENRDKFIQHVKDYIDMGFGNKDGVQILFNNDYSKLRKDIYSPFLD